MNGLCQVLVVRQDLKMKSGKIASQCARKDLFPFFMTILVPHPASHHF